MGKQEKYKAKEDNRDIFDKALDYAPLAGAIVGGAAFNRLSKPRLKRLTKDQNRVAWKDSRGESLTNTAVGAFGGGVGGSLLSDSRKERRK